MPSLVVFKGGRLCFLAPSPGEQENVTGFGCCLSPQNQTPTGSFLVPAASAFLIQQTHKIEFNSYITKVTSETTTNQNSIHISQRLYQKQPPIIHDKLYILYVSTTNRTIITRIEKSMKEISSMSTSKKEATFSLIAKSCIFSNLVLIIPHVLVRSRSQMMSAYESKGGKIGSKLNHYLQIST